MFHNIDEKYHLVTEAYSVTKNLFIQGRDSYERLKNRSLHVMDTFLDQVTIVNEEMAKELRSAIIKFYKIKYFHDFTHYVISMEEIVNITEHCLKEPVEKLELIRKQFHNVIYNFHDSRNFEIVNKCYSELPDEVATAHCLLHQAVLFNETMEASLIAIVEIKTRQHAKDMNATLFGVRECLNDFVPNFYEQLLVDAYTNSCGFLKVANASVSDLIEDRWKKYHQTKLPKKWSPLVDFFEENSMVKSNHE
ncbi:unnamed protein product [Parnassius apollo]|uniref:(apollo) hypothetical protein n=1 Tax=Parnassius apollo TaxID=110799 RepID=A0A8S3XAM2_PARAO|nr:unnamed protein product [Parnassius apollo]